MKTKQLFEFNHTKSEYTGQPNPNKEIGGSIINSTIRAKLARKELEKRKEENKAEAVKNIQTGYRGNRIRKQLSHDRDFQNNIAKKINDCANPPCPHLPEAEYLQPMSNSMNLMCVWECSFRIAYKGKGFTKGQ